MLCVPWCKSECNVYGRVSADIPFKITRDKHSKNIVTKRQKRTIRLFITNA